MTAASEIHTGLTNLHTREPPSHVEDPAVDGRSAGNDGGMKNRSIEESVFQPVSSPRLLELVELILKDRPRLERVIRDPSLAAELIPKFLAVSLVGFTLFGVAMALVIHAVGVRLELASMKAVLEGSAQGLIQFRPLGARSAMEFVGAITAGLRLIGAYDLGLIAAAGVCLPSLYFYGLLAGVPMSMARVTVHTVKAMSTTAVALVGILPIYMAFSLGAAIFHAPLVVVQCVLWLGLVLPFIAGLFGINSLYTGFTGLTDSLPPERRFRRACFLRRLVVSWSVCYTAVTPVMIFTLWEYFSRTP
jgi:hypothetical protein